MFLSANFQIFQYNYNKNLFKRTCKYYIRYKSSADLKTKTYSHTILLPKTEFPNRRKNFDINEFQKAAQFFGLYSWQREHNDGGYYILHDGPPYANGDLHMGHAVNKIIKDICNRSQILQGKKVHYIPGWDCHGLPIELKALQKAKKGEMKSRDPVQIREIARNFALETVAKQKDAFKQWGITADWDKDVYLTLNKGYIKNQLKQFHKMYKKGLIFRALKPVYWSPSSRTALAEAELEYDPQFKSQEVYVRFLFEQLPGNVKKFIDNKKIYALIWTTTPWTLVANRAICYNSQLKYGLVQLLRSPDDLYVVGVDLIDSLKKILSTDIVQLAEFDGVELKDSSYRNHLTKKTCPLLDGDHVTASKGTGLVHTAPAHGPDDFLVALKNNMAVDCNVDEAGCYMNLDSELNGLYVLKEGQDVVIQRLADSILHQDWFVHSYPLDWRTKKPVILRASHQWFIDTAALKNRALDALENVTIYPKSGAEQYRQGLKTQLEKRPYWCISRQRAWGAPIPVLYNNDEPIVDERIIDKLCELIDERGPDVWWTCDVAELLTDNVVKEMNSTKDLTKGMDIMDIWLDSGLSWSSVLEGQMADLYVEGVDQFTGWFQSSLLTSVALQGKAPYKSILVHGFAVDEKKRKMSKSIGNVIDPLTIVNGRKDKSQPAYGIDTLRWWVTSHGTQHTQIIVSKNVLEDCQNEVVRIRHIMKYLLGVINDLDKSQFDLKPELNYFDKYIVKQCYQFEKNVNEFSNTFKYNNIVQTVNFFVSNTVSGLYSHCVKDRLYCSPKTSSERLSSQLVMHTIFVFISKALGPILPHLVEEAWKFHPLYEKPFFFTKNIPLIPEASLDAAMMDLVLDLKKELHIAVKNELLKKFVVMIKADDYLFSKLNELNFNSGVNDSVLCEILEVASIVLEKQKQDGHQWSFEVKESDCKQCLRCRKYNVSSDSDKCVRCEVVVCC